MHACYKCYLHGRIILRFPDKLRIFYGEQSYAALLLQPIWIGIILFGVDAFSRANYDRYIILQGVVHAL